MMKLEKEESRDLHNLKPFRSPCRSHKVYFAIQITKLEDKDKLEVLMHQRKTVFIKP